MTSSMRVLPELRIIQQEFDRRDKRPYPGKSGRGTSDDDEDEDGNKARKKPGRKPNPASPAVRKEQNRAAQRAFRDRKERHLQEMESTIKELKETNNDITQEARRLKDANELLQSENFYLREVVFSFETALSKGGHVVILQEVKAELYRRHYEKHSARKLAPPPPPPPVTTTTTASTQDHQQNSTQSMFIPTGSFLIRPESTDAVSSARQRQEFGQAVVNAITINCSKSPSPPASVTSSSLSTSNSSTSLSDSPPLPSRACSPVVWERLGTKAAADPHDDNIFSMSSDIFYKAPSPRSFLDAYHARLARSSSPFSPITIPRSAMSGQDTEMGARVTEYTKQPTMFDELQSSLFPPGTLQSLIHNNLSTPQEIVNDVSLLDQLDSSAPSKDRVVSSGYQAFPFSLSLMDSPLPNEPSSILDDDNGEYRLSTPTLGLDDGLKQEVIPSKRLQLEIRVLASAPPAVDPNIDVKVYSLPHDPRIDLIPCPRLRAQMILHQNKFDIEDLCQLLINEAICHGHPLDPHSWELPERFFDRYGFLLGQEMLRHRNKIWPKKDEPLLETSKAH
ncbi:hypothetical protein BG015_011700 [Linnemannia schmuckeri]|uniref:BZIP domain-containing protein n=1 Tax=Linnemannia schmuckeri TaxID=64567 RepID=A0A9P5RSE0_9FUNG|nr:hypothetical protein BG015_011700 [Linnemannia schmuckeri]